MSTHKYRLSQQVSDRGWVDFDLDVPPILPNCSAYSAYLSPAKAESGRQRNSKNQSKPNPGPTPAGTPCTPSKKPSQRCCVHFAFPENLIVERCLCNAYDRPPQFGSLSRRPRELPRSWGGRRRRDPPAAALQVPPEVPPADRVRAGDVSRVLHLHAEEPLRGRQKVVERHGALRKRKGLIVGNEFVRHKESASWTVNFNE